MLRAIASGSLLLLLSLGQCTIPTASGTGCIPAEDGSCSVQPQ